MPRTITHELALRGAGQLLAAFLSQTEGLGEKRGPILVQTPSSQSFDRRVTARFLELVRRHYAGPLVWEPRNGTWFSPGVTSLLARYQVALVAADPAPVPAGAIPAAWPLVVYFRLHGAPRKYWSRYSEADIQTLARTLRGMVTATEAWCVFDNTAGGAAIENALELLERLEDKKDPTDGAR